MCISAVVTYTAYSKLFLMMEGDEVCVDKPKLEHAFIMFLCPLGLRVGLFPISRAQGLRMRLLAARYSLATRAEGGLLALASVKNSRRL